MGCPLHDDNEQDVCIRSSFNQDIASCNVSYVTDMSSMFECGSLRCLIKTYHQFCTDRSSMFREVVAFDQNISAWSVSSVRA